MLGKCAASPQEKMFGIVTTIPSLYRFAIQCSYRKTLKKNLLLRSSCTLPYSTITYISLGADTGALQFDDFSDVSRIDEAVVVELRSVPHVLTEVVNLGALHLP